MNNIESFIEHTCLKPEATSLDIEKLCREAIEHQFRGVCTHPRFLPQAKKFLENTNILIVTVVGFPLGVSQLKALETKEACQRGADEIDMAINLGLLKEKEDEAVFQDIQEVVKAAGNKPVKVIIETCLLSEEEKILACQIAKRAGASFVKTSTGFSRGGATVEDIELIREVVGPSMGIKASGGIREADFAKALLNAGATRLGTSSSLKLTSSLCS